MRYILVFVIVCLLNILFFGCGDAEEEYQRAVRAVPVVADFRPDLVFTTIEPAEQVEGTQLGWVVVMDSEKKAPLRALVVPYRNIPSGIVVKIVEVEYLHQPTIAIRLLMVK